jgi:uncharacterized membrane protein
MDNFTPATPAVPAPAAGTNPPPREGWAVAAGQGLEWWRSGWDLFRRTPAIWIVLMVVFIAIMAGLSFIPFLGQIASTLLYPVLGAGVLVGARALDRGGELTVAHLFSCFNDKALPLIIVALLYFGGWFVIWLIAAALLVGIVGFGTVASIVSGDPTQAGIAMLATLGAGSLIVVLLATLLGIPLIMGYWFAPALVLFRGDEPFAAMKASFTACMRNMPPFLIYGLLGIVFAVVASIPFGLGWLILLPVYAASMYASYKDIFGEPAE